MAKTRRDTIDMATGPYEINPDNSKTMSDKVRFRHYKPDELQVAKRFITKNKLAGTYFFDVYLWTVAAREIIPQTEPFPVNDAVPWMDRIDAICHKRDHVYIIEFKTRMNPTGLGELLYYKQAYIEQYKPAKGVKLLYVVETLKPEMEKVLKELDIEYMVV